jgi:hypothetical protein
MDKNMYSILFGDSEVRKHLGDLGVDGKLILKWLSK